MTPRGRSTHNDRRRGRSADRCRQGQSLGSQGCHHDPCRLPPRSASSELVDLRWDQIDFTHAVLHKKGTPATHPVVGDEMRALRKLQREQDPKSPFVFTSERGSPFTTAGFARMVERAGVEAKLGFPATAYPDGHRPDPGR